MWPPGKLCSGRGLEKSHFFSGRRATARSAPRPRRWLNSLKNRIPAQMQRIRCAGTTRLENIFARLEGDEESNFYGAECGRQ